MSAHMRHKCYVFYQAKCLVSDMAFCVIKAHKVSITQVRTQYTVYLLMLEVG